MSRDPSRRAHALLVHGAGGGGWEWATWARVFEAAGVAVEAPDLSPVPEGLRSTRLADYIAQAQTSLQALPRPRLVVGASLGGLIAVAVAGQADALVLVNPLPPAPWASALPERDWPEVVSWGRDARLESTRSAVPEADPATALFAFRRWRDESGQVMREAHAGVALPRPECPVLCMVSEEDRDVPPATATAMTKAWGSDLIERRGASHVGPLLGREAAECAGRVLAWLGRQPVFTKPPRGMSSRD